MFIKPIYEVIAPDKCSNGNDFIAFCNDEFNFSASGLLPSSYVLFILSSKSSPLRTVSSNKGLHPVPSFSRYDLSFIGCTPVAISPIINIMVYIYLTFLTFHFKYP